MFPLPLRSHLHPSLTHPGLYQVAESMILMTLPHTPSPDLKLPKAQLATPSDPPWVAAPISNQGNIVEHRSCNLSGLPFRSLHIPWIIFSFLKPSAGIVGMDFLSCCRAFRTSFITRSYLYSDLGSEERRKKHGKRLEYGSIIVLLILKG